MGTIIPRLIQRAFASRFDIRVTPGQFTFGGNLCFRQRRKTARIGQLHRGVIPHAAGASVGEVGKGIKAFVKFLSCFFFFFSVSFFLSRRRRVARFISSKVSFCNSCTVSRTMVVHQARFDFSRRNWINFLLLLCCRVIGKWRKKVLRRAYA